jgi:hypothetical protein
MTWRAALIGKHAQQARLERGETRAPQFAHVDPVERQRRKHLDQRAHLAFEIVQRLPLCCTLIGRSLEKARPVPQQQALERQIVVRNERFVAAPDLTHQAWRRASSRRKQLRLLAERARERTAFVPHERVVDRRRHTARDGAVGDVVDVRDETRHAVRFARRRLGLVEKRVAAQLHTVPQKLPRQRSGAERRELQLLAQIGDIRCQPAHQRRKRTHSRQSRVGGAARHPELHDVPQNDRRACLEVGLGVWRAERRLRAVETR